MEPAVLLIESKVALFPLGLEDTRPEFRDGSDTGGDVVRRADDRTVSMSYQFRQVDALK